MFNNKTASLLFLIVFLICSWLFLYLNLINPLFTTLLILILISTLTFLYLRNLRSSRKIEIDLEDTQEKINTITLEIQAKEKYLNYLPESSQRLNLFKKLIEELIKFQELEDVYIFLSKEIKAIFKDLSVFLLYAIEEDKLKLVSSYKRDLSPIKYKQGDILDYWVLKHNQAILIEDIAQDFRFDLEKIHSLRERVMNSLISAPMSLGEKVIGILRVESKEKRRFNFEDLRILSVIADLASVVIDRANIFKKVQDLAIKDGMTGLFLRGYFIKRLKEEMNRALITQSSIGIILADVDLFKKLNDKFGHTVGDLVLKKLSEVLKEVIGDAGNVISRFGGEEFIVLLASSSKENAAKIAEALRKKVEQTPVVFRRKKINFTISVGVSSFPQDSKFLEDLIKKADDALYKAKRKGRNKVCLAG